MLFSCQPFLKINAFILLQTGEGRYRDDKDHLYASIPDGGCHPGCLHEKQLANRLSVNHE
jgi:hypothetical protein